MRKNNFASLRMKFYLLGFIFFIAVIFSSCNEEKDSPLLFEPTTNTNPEFIHLSYHPEEIGITFFPKESRYFISSYTYIDGDLELTCTNCDNIDSSTDFSFSIIEDNVGKAISATEKEVGVFVNISESKTLRIHFAKLSDEELPFGFLGARATIKVYGRVGGKDVNTSISVYRSNQRFSTKS